MITRQDKWKQNTDYRLMLNDKMTEIKLWRIKTIKGHFDELIKRKEITSEEGYFKYKTSMFSSHMVYTNVDVAFVDSDGLIIDYYIDFKPNKITKDNPDAKFLYIFGENTFRYNGIKPGDNIFHQKWKRK